MSNEFEALGRRSCQSGQAAPGRRSSHFHQENWNTAAACPATIPVGGLLITRLVIPVDVHEAVRVVSVNEHDILVLRIRGRWAGEKGEYLQTANESLVGW